MTPKILKFFRHGSEKAVTTTALFFALLYNIRTICSYRRVLRHLRENNGLRHHRGQALFRTYPIRAA